MMPPEYEAKSANFDILQVRKVHSPQNLTHHAVYPVLPLGLYTISR